MKNTISQLELADILYCPDGYRRSLENFHFDLLTDLLTVK